MHAVFSAVDFRVRHGVRNHIKRWTHPHPPTPLLCCGRSFSRNVRQEHKSSQLKLAHIAHTIRHGNRLVSGFVFVFLPSSRHTHTHKGVFTSSRAANYVWHQCEARPGR